MMAANPPVTMMPAASVPGLLRAQAARYAERTMIRHHLDDSWRILSWTQVWEMVLGAAERLLGEGVRPGDHVILFSHNSLAWLVEDWAIQAVGGITVPVYPSTTAEIFGVEADNSEAVLALVENEALAEVAAAGAPGLRRLRLEEIWPPAPATPKGREKVEDSVDRLTPERISTVVYTSGTTGMPKGVVLSHSNVVTMAAIAAADFRVDEDDLVLSYLPYSHVFERINCITVALAAGGTIAISRGLDFLRDDIGAVRPTLMIAVPRVLEKMREAILATAQTAGGLQGRLLRWGLAVAEEAAAAGDEVEPDLRWRLADRLVFGRLRERVSGGRLRQLVSGGAALPPQVERFFWGIGIPVYQGWGLTESSSGATSNLAGRHRVGTVGKPLTGVQVRLAADGELLLAGPGIMQGYHRDPAATAAVLRDGWLATGDVGEIDPDGFIRITDRKKELIKTAGGKYVAPQQLEALLEAEPEIQRAVVLGEGRPFIIALLLPSTELAGSVDDVAATLRRAVDRVNARLSSFEQVKHFLVMDRDLTEAEGELTPTLKVRRQVVSQHYREAIDQLYAVAARSRAPGS